MITSGVVKRQRIANEKLTIARKFRKEMTESETLLWKKVRKCQLGVKIRRQQIVEGFIVDFFCESAKLVIEVDGDVHDNEEQKKTDQLRRLVFEERGLQEIRFTNEQVKFSINRVLDEIRNIVLTSPRRPPSGSATTSMRRPEERGGRKKCVMQEHAHK
ncbi:MAG: DUF559 domain-containing protein [Fibrobacter sp.]|nr:DUF559 domain-containing protein [Fibrobacter sp.]